MFTRRMTPPYRPEMIRGSTPNISTKKPKTATL